MIKSVSEINRLIDEHKTIELIVSSEENHEAQYENIINTIVSKMMDIRIVCVAGPSSSGKTTFSNRLIDRLGIKNIQAVVLSLDDFFYDRNELDHIFENEVDFESVKCVNHDLFIDCLNRLLSGETVSLPTYDFTIGRKIYTDRLIQIDESTLIFIEGIHALNYEFVFKDFNTELLAGIYISPQVEFEDSPSKFSGPELRLIRRIVRDGYYRNCDILNTLIMWKGVLRGESLYIMPYKKNADFVFNSFLPYELCILKKHFFTQYNELDSKGKAEVQKFVDVDYLSKFNDLPDNLVPGSSILKEFFLM